MENYLLLYLLLSLFWLYKVELTKKASVSSTFFKSWLRLWSAYSENERIVNHQLRLSDPDHGKASSVESFIYQTSKMSLLSKAIVKVAGLSVLIFGYSNVVGQTTTNIVSGGSITTPAWHLPNSFASMSIPLTSGGCANSSNTIIDFNFAGQNLNNALNAGCCNGNSSPLATLELVVNGTVIWRARTPNDDNVHSGDIQTLVGTQLMGPGVPWSISQFMTDLRHRVQIMLPSWLTPLTSVEFRYSSGQDDFMARMNSIMAVVPPAAPTVANSNVTYCQGAGIPAITATAPSGASLQWYSASSGGSLLGSGASLTPSGCSSSSRTAITVTEVTCDSDGGRWKI